MKHFMKTTLSIALIALAPHSYAANTNNTANTISPAERAKIEQVVQEYILQKPEIIVQAVQKLQQKQYEEAEQTVKKTQQIASGFSKALFHQANDPIAGNSKGKITIVEFFDYQCQHCIDMAPVIAETIKANPDVRIVYKDFPIRGPVSEFAARAALAANKQGKYYDFSHALLTTNKPLTQDLVLQIAKEKGLNIEKLKKDMNDKSVNDVLQSNMKLAKDLKLFGTPAFFIGKTDANGEINYIPGQINQKPLQDLIDKTSK